MLIAISVLVLLGISTVAFADNPAAVGFLELDGNVVPGNCNGTSNCTGGTLTCPSSPSSSSITDWSCLFNQVSLFTGSTPPTPAQIAAAYQSLGLPAQALVDAFVPDGYSGGPLCPAAAGGSCPDPSTYTSGSKDILDVSANSCASSNNLLAKDNLENTYGIKYVNPTDGHQIVFIGDEKQSNGGDNNIGVWFDQNIISVPNPCPGGSGVLFSGTHAVGDILTVSNFTKGGVLAGVNAYVWVGSASSCPSGTTGSPPLCHKFTGNVCNPSAPSTQFICAIVSHVTTPGIPGGSPTGNDCGFPWVTQSSQFKPQMNNTLTGEHCTAVNAFYEMGIDLTALGFTSCSTTGIPETRSSQSLTATIFDFTILNLNSCETQTTTQASQTGAVASGTSVTDTATVSSTNGGGTPTGSVQFYACGPTTAATSCAITTANAFGSPVPLNSGQATSGAVSGTSTPVNDNLGGFYCFSAVYLPSGGFVTSQSTTITNECFEVVTSAISTSVSPSTIALGSSATDTATVTLTPSSATVAGTVDFTVFGPVSTNTPTCTTVAQTFTGVPIAGTGTGAATSPSFTPTAAGYYFWEATYNPVGAANGNSVTSPCGATGETLLVISSAITTSVSPSTIALGSTSSDTATVTLTPSTSTVSGTIDFRVYGPVSTNTPTCTTLAGSFLGVPIGPGISPQSAASGSFKPAAAGYYFWTATYNPAGASNGNSVSTSCGDSGETLTVVSSAITTSVSPSTITFGNSASDTATVTLTPGTSTVSGTVDFFVYGPVSTNTPTCTTLAASFKGVAIGPGVSPQSATSAAFTPTATGYYFWTATYNPAGASNGNSVSTSCGDSGETLLVSSIPKITFFGYTNTPTNNDPTLGSGTVEYNFTVHNYGTNSVTLTGILDLSGSTPGVVSGCTSIGANTVTFSGLVGTFSGVTVAPGADAKFAVTCNYSGNSGNLVSASLNVSFTDLNNAVGPVSGSPATVSFTIQKT